MRYWRAAACGFVWVALAADVPVASSQVIAHVSVATPVAAYGGHVVWSERDGRTHRFMLIDVVDGIRHRTRATERAVPYDVDLGPDAAGRPVAVYSRCHHEDWPSEDLHSGLIAYGFPGARDQGCHLYRLRLPDGREQRLRGIGRGGSDALPTIWGRTLAFVRTYPRRPGIAAVLPHVMYAHGAGRPHEIRGGSRGAYDFYGYIKRHVVVVGGPGPTRLDLSADALAFAWQSSPRRCNRSRGGRVGPAVQEIWRARLGRSRRLIARACQVASGQGLAGVYGASFGPVELNYLAYAPTRSPAYLLGAWSPVCPVRLRPIDTPGIPVALASGASGSYVLMKLAEHSFDLVRNPVEASC